MLIILFGDIGVGKSTVAGALARTFGFRLIQFDPLVPSVTGKKEMYGENLDFLQFTFFADISKRKFMLR